MIYAYARVSTRDQNLDRQLNAFASLNIDKRNIFCDKKKRKRLRAHTILPPVAQTEIGRSARHKKYRLARTQLRHDNRRMEQNYR